MNMVWARYTNLVKVEWLLVNQNRKWCIYYMYHYVLNINVYHIHYVCIILFITDTRNRKYMIPSLSFFMCFTFEVSPICLSIGTLNRTFCQFIWLICDIFFKDKVLVINALSIIKKKCTNVKILEQLCLLTKYLPLSKFKYRWDFYGGKHS